MSTRFGALSGDNVHVCRDVTCSVTYGARHATVFTEMVEHSGRVDELRLPLKTKGMFNIPEMIKLLPVGIRAQLRGKMPPIIHKKNPGQENVRRIFKKVESDR